MSDMIFILLLVLPLHLTKWPGLFASQLASSQVAEVIASGFTSKFANWLVI